MMQYTSWIIGRVQQFCNLAFRSFDSLESFLAKILPLIQKIFLLNKYLSDFISIYCREIKMYQLVEGRFRYHKLRKTFSKFYRRHYELVSKFGVGLKTLLHQGLSEPEFYGDLVYKFKKIVGKADFSDQFRKIIVRYKRIGYNINIMRQSACLVFNPITVNNFASLFNCTPVGRASDSMMAPT